MGGLCGVTSCFLQICIENVHIFAENEYKANMGILTRTTLTERLRK
jgi:hypothetical protein